MSMFTITTCDQCPIVKFMRLLPDAVIPTKGTQLSVGYDLTAIGIEKQLNSRTTLYKTGISVQPPSGYYTEIVARSSISKSGYMLANGIGTIDADYTGELFLALIRINDAAAPLECPFKLCQLVLHKAEYYKMEESKKLTETKRGAGGFGSTDTI